MAVLAKLRALPADMPMTDDEFFNAIRDAISPAYRCEPFSGKLEHVEKHEGGRTSVFCLRPSQKMVAFSLDKPGKTAFEVLGRGLDSKNDLTVICRGSSGHALVFVIECKNSRQTLGAQGQIECGIAFCEYLFKLLLSRCRFKVEARFLGVLVNDTRTPTKGTTRPSRMVFTRQGLYSVWRAQWPISVPLPMTELIRAAEEAVK